MTGAELRASILQAAVQGRLVLQDPTDEPASELLERIREERAELVKAKKVKAPRGGESVITRYSDGTVWERRGKGDAVEITDEVPFDIPEGWEWCRFGSLLVNRDAERIPVSVADRLKLAKIYDYYGASGVIDKIDRYLFDKPLLLIGEDGANLLSRSTPIAFMARGQYWVNNHAHVLDGISEQLLEYVCVFINSISLAPYVTGTAQPKMNQAKMNTILVAVPPEREQERILSKLEELMPLVERYDGLDRERTELNAGIEGAMRASVLQAAVQGRLTEREDGDEPASELLERIREERQELVKAKKAKAPKGGESRIWRADDGTVWEQRGKDKAIDITDEIPFDIPDGWEWARLGVIFDMQAGKNIASSMIASVEDEKHPYRCFGGNGVRGYVGEPNRCGDYPIIGRQGALCGNIKRGVGEFYATEHAVIVDTFANTDVAWSCLFLDALNLNQYATATAQPGLAVSRISTVLIPVPPLAEQKRIVAKLDEMLPKVERLGELAS